MLICILVCTLILGFISTYDDFIEGELAESRKLRSPTGETESSVSRPLILK